MCNFSEKEKVVFIMPAYNAEAYIEPSIMSVLNQTYRNLELVVVNDGSTDSTADILEKIAEKDCRLKILTVENGGPASARNAALDSLDGSSDYIMFCDSDDFLKPDMVERAVESARDGTDFVLMGFTIVNADGTKNDYFEPDMKLDNDTIGAVLGNLYKANLLNQVWGKLFRSDIIFDKTIRFPDYYWGEDRFFVFEYLNNSYTVNVLSYCGYEYVMHKGQSLITGFYKNKAEICVLIDERMEELCRKYKVKDDSAFRYMFAKSIFSCFANLFSPTCKLSHSEKRNYIWKIISDEHVLERCKGAKGSLAIRIICWIMSTGSISLNMFAAYAASLFSKLSPDSFRKIKHKK